MIPEMHLASQPLKKTVMHYRYANCGFASVELWVVHPPDCSVQDQVCVVEQSLQPKEEIILGSNTVYRYTVPRFSTLSLEWSFRSIGVSLREGHPSHIPEISDLDRTRYLYQSSQAPINVNIQSEANSLVGDRVNPIEKVQAILSGVARRFSYRYPVLKRGAHEMLATGKGDCGQFSLVVEAMCRATGIPARTIYGALLGRRVDWGHVWVEVWIDGIGWIPVDPAFENARILGRAAQSENSSVLTGPWFQGERFAFSVGEDLFLGEKYGQPVRPLPLSACLSPRISFGGHRLAWGYETIAGRIPYLQPAYPKCRRGRGLDFLTSCSPLGHWTPDAAFLPWIRVFDVLQQSFFLVVVVLTLASCLLARDSPRWFRVFLDALAIVQLGLFLGLYFWMTGRLTMKIRAGLLACVAALVSLTATPPDYVGSAKHLITELSQRHFEEVNKQFNDGMKKAFPPKKLAEFWDELLAQVGDFIKVVKTRTGKEGPYNIVVATCAFAKSNLDMKVVFDSKGLVAGLTLNPAQGSSAGQFPSSRSPSTFRYAEITRATRNFAASILGRIFG